MQAAIADYVQRAVSTFADQVLYIVLYGSQARQEANDESDIDLFIVVRDDSPTLRQQSADLAWHVQFEHDVVISDIVYSLAQFNRMQARQFPYYQSLIEEGILLWKNASVPMLDFA